MDIGCVTCSYRISEGSKTALSDDLQYIIIALQYKWLSRKTWLLGTSEDVDKLTSWQRQDIMITRKYSKY